MNLEEITKIASAAIQAKTLSWVGFSQDDNGEFTVPVIPKGVIDLINLCIEAENRKALIPIDDDTLADLAVECGADNMVSCMTHPNGPRTSVKFNVADGSLQRFRDKLLAETPPSYVFKAIKHARDVAMKSMVAADIPLCAEFGEIAQSLDYAVSVFNTNYENQIYQMVEGMTVSVDVTTGDDCYFGQIDGLYWKSGVKNGMVLLVQNPQKNF